MSLSSCFFDDSRLWALGRWNNFVCKVLEALWKHKSQIWNGIIVWERWGGTFCCSKLPRRWGKGRGLLLLTSNQDAVQPARARVEGGIDAAFPLEKPLCLQCPRRSQTWDFLFQALKIGVSLSLLTSHSQMRSFSGASHRWAKARGCRLGKVGVDRGVRKSL